MPWNTSCHRSPSAVTRTILRVSPAQRSAANAANTNPKRAIGILEWYNTNSNEVPGQVAQLVERSPEKAGVGGSIPSLATTKSTTYKLCLCQTCSILFQ